MPAHEIDSTNIRFERDLAETMFGKKELPLQTQEQVSQRPWPFSIQFRGRKR